MNFQRSKINQAVISVIAGMTAGAATADQGVIEEVVVTATKRAESTQDIPVAVEALTSDSLEDFGITNFEDYLIQLPGVTAGEVVQARIQFTYEASRQRHQTLRPPASRVLRLMSPCT